MPRRRLRLTRCCNSLHSIFSCHREKVAPRGSLACLVDARLRISANQVSRLMRRMSPKMAPFARSASNILQRQKLNAWPRQASPRSPVGETRRRQKLQFRRQAHQVAAHRAFAPCSKCGREGASLTAPSWDNLDIGFGPFPAEQTLRPEGVFDFH
jgi:hypothetical protein